MKSSKIGEIAGGSGISRSAARANARGLKAANKKTNKTGTKSDRSDRATLQGNANIIKNASPARANRTRGGSLAAIKEFGGQGLATAKLSPKQAANQAEITRELNPVRKSVSKLTLRQKAGKAIVNATTGKTSARKYAEFKMRENAKPKLPSTNTKPGASPKSAVRTKTAAKQRPGKKDIMTVIRKRAIRNEQMQQQGKPGFSTGKTKLLRQVKASNKSK